MFNGNKAAYYVIPAVPAPALAFDLPFNERLKSYADVRLLVVPIPPEPRPMTLAQRTLGAFPLHDIRERNLRQTPTEHELRQLHVVGLDLQKHAMAGERNFAFAVWTERRAGRNARTGRMMAYREIMVSHVFSMMKFDVGKWSPGFFRDQEKTFYSIEEEGRVVSGTIDEAKDALYKVLESKPVDLSAVSLDDELEPVPPTRVWRAACRQNAIELRRAGCVRADDGRVFLGITGKFGLTGVL